MEYYKIRGFPLLLGFDVNSHRILLGNIDINSRGNNLFEYLVTSTSLCAGSFRHNVKKWRISEEPNFSDYSQVERELESTVPASPKWAKIPYEWIGASILLN